jgi:hypothetical protein
VRVQNDSADDLSAAAGTELINAYTGPDKAHLLGQYVVPAGKIEKLKHGTGRTYKISFDFPAIGDANEIAPGTYGYYVELDPVWKGRVGASGEPLQFVDQFGNVGDRKDVTATVRGSSSIPGATVAAGGTIKLSLKGGGTGTVTVNGGETDVSLTGTTAATEVTVEDPKVTGKIHNLSANTPVKKIDMPNVDFTGTVSFTAGLGGLVAHDLGGTATPATITIGKADPKPVPVAFAVHKINNVNISVDDGVAFLGTGEWTDSDPATLDMLTAPFVDQLLVKKADDASTTGGMQAALKLQGPALTNKKFALNKADIDGSAKGAWDLGAGGAKEIKVHDGSEWQVTTTGPVNELTVADSWNNSLAGPMLEAKSVGELVVGGPAQMGTLKGPEIKVTGAADGVAIRKLETAFLNLDKLTAPAGGIGKLSTFQGLGFTSGGNIAITAQWADTIEEKKTSFSTPSLLAADVQLTKTKGTSDTSLRKLDFGRLIGSLSAFGDVDEISASDDAHGWSLTGGQDAGSPGCLVTDLHVTNANGSIKASAFNHVILGGNVFTGTLEATLPVPIQELGVADMQGTITALAGVKTLVANTWTGGTLNAGSAKHLEVVDTAMNGTFNLPFGATNVQVGKWTGGTFTAGPIKHLTIDGSATNVAFNLDGGATSFIAGSMTDCQINAAGQNIAVFKIRGTKTDPVPNFTRTTLTAGMVRDLLIQGSADHSTFNLNGGAGSVIVGSMADCSVNAAGQTIAVFKIRGIDDSLAPYFMRTNVTADVLGTVVLNDVDEDSGSPAYGITAHIVGGYSRFVNGKAFEFTVNGKKTHLLVAPPPGVADHLGNYSLTIT